MVIQKLKLSQLIPAPYNPRQSNQEQERQLKTSLEKFGAVEPIVVNKQTNHIVGGHFRVRELKKLGYKEIECVIVDLSLEDEKELNVRLNANTGSWDWDAAANNFEAEELKEWGLDVPNFDNTDNELKDLSDTIDNLYRIEIICKDEEHQENTYNKLIEQGYECRLLTL